MRSLLSLFLTLLSLLLLVAADKNQISFRLHKDIPTRSNDATFQKQRFLWNSKLAFEKPVMEVLDAPDQDGKNAQLGGIARDAYWQMTQVEGYPSKKSKKRPWVMTALAIGNELYLSSSVKGGSFIYYEKNKDNPLYQCLVQCQIQFAAAGGDEAEEHKNGASCGECMTGYAYFQDHPDAKDLSGGYWATVKNSDQDNLAFENIEMFDPCATEYLGEDNPAQFGCAQLAKTINCTPVTKKDFKEVSLDENSITFSQPHLQCTVSEPQRKKRALEIAA